MDMAAAFILPSLTLINLSTGPGYIAASYLTNKNGHKHVLLKPLRCIQLVTLSAACPHNMCPKISITQASQELSSHITIKIPISTETMQ